MNLLTNCPNCGAPLSSDGYCSYCNTKVRYANEIETESFMRGGIMNMKPTEILFKFKNEDTLLLLPFYGKVSNMSLMYNEDCYNYMGNIKKIASTPSIEMTLEGEIRNIEELQCY